MKKKYVLPKPNKKKKRLSTNEFIKLANRVKKYFEEEEQYAHNTTKSPFAS